MGILKDYAEAMCARLASIYGGESYLSSIEPDREPDWWTLRVSVIWAGKSITRAVKVRLNSTRAMVLESKIQEER